jgi:hypothetical protein
MGHDVQAGNRDTGTIGSTHGPAADPEHNPVCVHELLTQNRLKATMVGTGDRWRRCAHPTRPIGELAQEIRS